MKAPRKPSKPKKPIKPDKLIKKFGSVRICYNDKKAYIEDLADKIAKKTQIPISINCTIDGEEIIEARIKFHGSVLYHFQVENTNYEKQMKAYKEKLKKYNLKMKEYSNKLKTYNIEKKIHQAWLHGKKKEKAKNEIAKYQKILRDLEQGDKELSADAKKFVKDSKR